MGYCKASSPAVGASCTAGEQSAATERIGSPADASYRNFNQPYQPNLEAQVDESERNLLSQAWKMISHSENLYDGEQQDNVVSMRNLIVFLVGIENIFINSMTKNDETERANKNFNLLN